jgi:hypothetical protein
MDTAGNTTDLMLALGRYDAFLAQLHVQRFGGDPKRVLAQVMEARERQLAAHLGELYFRGWWPAHADDLGVLPVVSRTAARAG